MKSRYVGTYHPTEGWRDASEVEDTKMGIWERIKAWLCRKTGCGEPPRG